MKLFVSNQIGHGSCVPDLTETSFARLPWTASGRNETLAAGPEIESSGLR
jgi:hypothetical protein